MTTELGHREATVVLRDGATVYVRLATSADAPAVEQLLEGSGHEYPTDRPSGGTYMNCTFQCLACHKWTVLGITSGLDDGSWMRFEATSSSHGE